MEEKSSRSKSIYFFHPRRNPLKGFFGQRFSPREDVFAFQRPVDDLSRRPPWLDVRTWKHRGLRRGRLLPAVGRQRPSRSSLTGGNNKQTFACCCVAIVGAAKYTFLHPIAERAQRLKENPGPF